MRSVQKGQTWCKDTYRKINFSQVCKIDHQKYEQCLDILKFTCAFDLRVQSNIFCVIHVYSKLDSHY